MAALSYLAPKLEGELIPHPLGVWPFWPGCAFLIAALLLVHRRIWWILIPAAFAGFVLFDLQAGIHLRSIAWFIPADAVEVVMAGYGLRYLVDGVPRLNNIRGLIRYLFVAALLAPFAAAFISAPGIPGTYWDGWRICFFSEVLALLTLTPAILNWVVNRHTWIRKSRSYHLEAVTMITGLVLLSYLSCTTPAGSSSPALLYSLLPLLLWSALRFGSVGISSAVMVVVFFSIWGAVHGGGPFVEPGKVDDVFSLQLFLIFSATPFMVLAAVQEERKGAGEALRTSEERLRLAVQAGRMYAFEWDAETDVIVRSGECKAILDWIDDPTRDTGRGFVNKVHPDDREAYAASEGGLATETPTYHVGYRVLRPDDTVIWLDARGHAFFDDKGNVLRIIGMVVDVTERRKAEEAVLQRAQELLEAQRVAQVGNWQWDPKTDLVTWSKELYRIAGRDPNLPPPAFGEQKQLYTPESWERLKRAIAEALQTGAPYTLDLEIVRPNGSTRWITDRGEALHDGAGRITRLRGTAQDITERTHAEGKLRASEERFRSVFREAGVGMVIVSPEGRFLAANQAFCDCLGYTEEELLQKTVQSVTLPEDWPSFSQRLGEALEQGTGFQKVEKRCLHKSGRIVTTESSASLIRGLSDEPRYFVGEVLDITQRKLAEEALSGVSGRLIEAHEEERSWIARELHDDFNQRIALLTITLERAKQDLPATERAVRHRIEEASQHVSELGSDIQALSHRLHSSKLEYLGLVAAVTGFCQEFSNRQNVKIDFHSENIPKTLPKEISLCLFRIVQEALQNSLKHSGERSFEVSLKCAGNEIELTVHDSGVGFDPEVAISGHGLGLTSMKERLKLVDGHLSVDSKPQAGTTVHARVPLTPRMKSARAGG